jgi:hypothetical protein
LATRSDDPSSEAFAKGVAPPSVPGASADKGRRAGIALPRSFLARGAIAIALLGASILGWVEAPVRPEPFDEPPPLSLAWWIHPPADPGIADLDMVPVGRFGGFLPREIARGVRARAEFAVKDIADAFIQPDGKEILLSLEQASRRAGGLAQFYHSGDGGKTWSPQPLPEEYCARDQAAKIQWFAPGATPAFDCLPAPPPADAVDAGLATDALRFPAKAARDGLWLTTKAGPLWVVGGEPTLFKLPQKEAPTIARPHPGNRILVAAPDGFVTLSPGSVPLVAGANLGNQSSASPKGNGFGAAPSNAAAPDSKLFDIAPLAKPVAPGGLFDIAPPAKQATPSGLNRAQTAQRAPAVQSPVQQGPAQLNAPPAAEVSAPTVSDMTEIRDPAYPGRTSPIRAIRVSGDGKSIIVAQEVARDNGVLVSHDAGESWSRLGYATGPPPWVVFLAFPLTVMATAAAARQLIRAPPGDPSIADEAATDRPIGLYDVDALQFAPIARGLLMFIRNPRTEPPVTIAVTGAWGSGKTSLMTILCDLLREHDARPVWFNAWHHQKEEHLLAALIENIRRQAIPSSGSWAGIFFRLRLLRRRFAGRLGVLLVLLAAALLVIGSYLSLSEQTTKQLQTSLLHLYLAAPDKAPEPATPAKGETKEGDWLLALVALLPPGLAVPVLLFGVLKNLQAFPRAKPEQLLGARGKDNFAGKLSFRYRFEHEFRETAAALRSPASPGLVVFIDDLDRCHTQNVMELLEAINFIVSAGECFVIVGMAKEQIRRSILASYKSEFLDIPKEAVRGGDIEAARRRFADRFLEKLINIEVPVPQAGADQIRLLLTGAAKPPDLPPGVALRRRLRFAYDNGPVILAAGFLVALFVWVHPYLARLDLSPAAAPPGAPTTPPTPSGAGAPRPPPPPPPVAETTPTSPGRPPAAAAAADVTVPQIYASDKDLAAAAPRAGLPWAQLALALALLAAAGAYLARLWVLAKQRPASDSQPFREALTLWTKVIFLASRTPRAVKQYKNMLRYQAMRLRALKATGEAKADIPEPDLVALGAISLAERTLLVAALPPGGKPLRSLVKDAAIKAPPGERAVLEEISTSLGERHGPPVEGRPSAALELSIGQYLALLPPVA